VIELAYPIDESDKENAHELSPVENQNPNRAVVNMKVTPLKVSLERDGSNISNDERPQQNKDLNWAFRPLLCWINWILGLNNQFLRILFYAINFTIHISLFSVFHYRYMRVNDGNLLSPDRLFELKNHNSTNKDGNEQNNENISSTISWNTSIDYANYTLHSLGIHTVLIVGPWFKRRWNALWISIDEMESMINPPSYSIEMITKFRRISIRFLVYIFISVYILNIYSHSLIFYQLLMCGHDDVHRMVACVFS